MNLEIEATFLEINKTALRERLAALGAKLVHPEILMRRVVFDTGPHSFARVRDEGRDVVLTYKIHHDDSLTGTEEYNVVVSDYDNTITILKRSGLQAKASQESLREEWDLNGTKIDIDTWPWLPAYVEIEGETADAVRSVAEQLGFDMQSALFGSVDEIYHLYYDVSCDDINNHFPEVKFDSAPALLLDHVRETPLAPATMKHEKSCGAVIVHDGCVLLEHQTNDHWSFPKGHVETGETELETTLREVKEETDLDITVDPSLRYTFSYTIDRKDLDDRPANRQHPTDIDKEVVLFLAHLKNPQQALKKQDSEISELVWVPFAEVESTLNRESYREAWRYFHAKI